MARRSPAVLLLFAALLAGGCGSSAPKKAAAPPKPRMTKAQYVAAGNKICRATVQKSPFFPGTRAGNQFNTTPKLMIAYLQAVENLTIQANKGLKVLRPPLALEQQHKDILAAQEARIHDMGLALNAASSRDKTNLNKAVQQDTNVDGPRYVAAVKKAGLIDCTRRLKRG